MLIFIFMTVFIYYGKMWRKYFLFAISANIRNICARHYVNFCENYNILNLKFSFVGYSR
jgi:hypothetical protein